MKQIQVSGTYSLVLAAGDGNRAVLARTWIATVLHRLLAAFPSTRLGSVIGLASIAESDNLFKKQLVTKTTLEERSRVLKSQGECQYNFYCARLHLRRPCLKKDVSIYVSVCLTCSLNARSRISFEKWQKRTGLLGPFIFQSLIILPSVSCQMIPDRCTSVPVSHGARISASVIVSASFVATFLNTRINFSFQTGNLNTKGIKQKPNLKIHARIFRFRN